MGFFMVSVTMITSPLRGELRGYKILAIMRNGQKTIEKKRLLFALYNMKLKLTHRWY